MGEASGALLGHPSTRQAPPRLSVILPTYNEAEGLGDVLDRIGVALADVPHEVVVVDDDSPDGTWRVAERRAARDPCVRVLRRVGERGLATAVMAGLRAARGEFVAVMDADGQHPPEALPLLLDAAASTEADVAIASRRVAGGEDDGLSRARLVASGGATLLARLALPTVRRARLVAASAGAHEPARLQDPPGAARGRAAAPRRRGPLPLRAARLGRLQAGRPRGGRLPRAPRLAGAPRAAQPPLRALRPRGPLGRPRQPRAPRAGAALARRRGRASRPGGEPRGAGDRRAVELRVERRAHLPRPPRVAPFLLPLPRLPRRAVAFPPRLLHRRVPRLRRGPPRPGRVRPGRRGGGRPRGARPQLDRRRALDLQLAQRRVGVRLAARHGLHGLLISRARPRGAHGGLARGVQQLRLGLLAALGLHAPVREEPLAVLPDLARQLLDALPRGGHGAHDRGRPPRGRVLQPRLKLRD